MEAESCRMVVLDEGAEVLVGLCHGARADVLVRQGFGSRASGNRVILNLSGSAALRDAFAQGDMLTLSRMLPGNGVTSGRGPTRAQLTPEDMALIDPEGHLSLVPVAVPVRVPDLLTYVQELARRRLEGHLLVLADDPMERTLGFVDDDAVECVSIALSKVKTDIAEDIRARAPIEAVLAAPPFNMTWEQFRLLIRTIGGRETLLGVNDETPVRFGINNTADSDSTLEGESLADAVWGATPKLPDKLVKFGPAKPILVTCEADLTPMRAIPDAKYPGWRTFTGLDVHDYAPVYCGEKQDSGILGTPELQRMNFRDDVLFPTERDEGYAAMAVQGAFRRVGNTVVRVWNWNGRCWWDVAYLNEADYTYEIRPGTRFYDAIRGENRIQALATSTDFDATLREAEASNL